MYSYSLLLRFYLLIFRYHHTTCSSLLVALRESLAIIAEEGLENWQKKHEQGYRRLKEGLVRLGFEFFVKDEKKRLITVTSVTVKDFDWMELINYAMKRLSISFLYKLISY